MATIEELIERYETDPELQKDVSEVLEDGKVTPAEFMKLAKKYDVDVSIMDLPRLLREAKEAGLIK